MLRLLKTAKRQNQFLQDALQAMIHNVKENERIEERLHGKSLVETRIHRKDLELLSQAIGQLREELDGFFNDEIDNMYREYEKTLENNELEFRGEY